MSAAESKSVQETFTEKVDSLTGYEEQEIQAQFGQGIATLLESDFTTASRAMVYTFRRRDGLDEVKAKDAAMRLTLKEVGAEFAPEVDEPMPDEPVTESGKDGSDV